MKTIAIAFILSAVFTANSQDDTTARFYGLPNNVTACQMMQGTYNGETKELKPIVQEQILFSNGVASSHHLRRIGGIIPELTMIIAFFFRPVRG